MKKYIPLLVFVFLCIIATSVAQAQGSRALGPLVDDYILPMVANGSTDFGPLKAYLVKLACIFGFGILGTFLFNYLMVGVTQGVQKTIGTTSSPRCSVSPCATLTATPPETSCRAIPATSTRCGR